MRSIAPTARSLAQQGLIYGEARLRKLATVLRECMNQQLSHTVGSPAHRCLLHAINLQNLCDTLHAVCAWLRPSKLRGQSSFVHRQRHILAMIEALLGCIACT